MKIPYEKGDLVVIVATGKTGLIYETGVGGELFIGGKPYYPEELRPAVNPDGDHAEKQHEDPLREG